VRHGAVAREAHHLFARRANEFTTIREFATTGECVAALRKDGRTIWVGGPRNIIYPDTSASSTAF